MNMTVYELSEPQKEELKIEMLKDKFGYKLSFRELPFANELISDRELFERFKDQTFTDNDFIVSR
jgi:hypothetical protein